MTVDIEVCDEYSAMTTERFRVYFQWAADRWCHTLDLRLNDSWTPVARSVEGNSERDGNERVVSPAFQQLQIQHAGAGAQALLVGQSGPHHFSGVFQVRELDGAVVAEVDIVDRCRAVVTALASTYRVELDSGALEHADSSGIIWHRPEWGNRRLLFLPWGPKETPARIALAEAGRGAMQVQAELAINEPGPTQRWFYQWRWDLIRDSSD